jgi:hypothetical protein
VESKIRAEGKGMRISEMLKLTPSDVNDRRLALKEPKSGREQEFIFIS